MRREREEAEERSNFSRSSKDLKKRVHANAFDPFSAAPENKKKFLLKNLQRN
jgi:hypothetical protein